MDDMTVNNHTAEEYGRIYAESWLDSLVEENFHEAKTRITSSAIEEAIMAASYASFDRDDETALAQFVGAATEAAEVTRESFVAEHTERCDECGCEVWPDLYCRCPDDEDC